MTASSADTAELPPVPTTRDAASVLSPPRPKTATLSVVTAPRAAEVAVPRAVITVALPSTPPQPGRAAIRAERRLVRRQRRLYAALGISVLAGTLGATVFVLDVFH